MTDKLLGGTQMVQKHEEKTYFSPIRRYESLTICENRRTGRSGRTWKELILQDLVELNLSKT